MISVVVPTSNNSKDLENCLKSLRSQSQKNLEIIVVAPRKDTAEKIIKKYGARIVYDDLSTIGNAYAVGAENARGAIIAFIDDDAFAPRNWLSTVLKEFGREHIDIIGGDDLLPPKSTAFQKAVYQIDLARRASRPMYAEKAKNRLRAVNIAFKRKIFDKFNFNKRLKGLQEPELLHRLFKAGYKMKFSPKLHVYHQRRRTLTDIFYQIYRNGKAKIEIIKLHKETISLIDIVPFLAISYILLIWISFPAKFLSYWLATLLIYFLLKPATILARTRAFKYYPFLFLIVLVREIAYALGILVGIKNIFKKF